MFAEERLSIEKHFNIVGNFSCGPDNPLNNFLMSDAFEYDSKRYGNTYVLFNEADPDEILGFYTLKTSAIQVKEDDEFNSIPVIEIARIAIAYDFQGSGIGGYVFHDKILPKILEVSQIVAVSAIIAFVDHDDENAVKFYKKIGFVKAEDEVQQQIAETFNEECDLYVVSLDNINVSNE